MAIKTQNNKILRYTDYDYHLGEVVPLIIGGFAFAGFIAMAGLVMVFLCV